MKIGLIVVLVLLASLVLFGGCGVSAYNGLVSKDENATARWTEIQNQYQRRADLVPQLVETVKGASNFERGTLEAVTEARASVGRVQLPDTTSPEQMKAYFQAQDGLSGALQRLLVVSENYPELRSVGNFQDLQAQLEGTENRLAVARNRFIEATRDYNVAIRRFPASVLAGMFGFQPKAQLEVPAGSTERPTIDFGK